LEPVPSTVRIVVLQPGASLPRGKPADGGSEAEVDTLTALGRIGAEVEIDVVRDGEACLRTCRRDDIDLVILDRCDWTDFDTVMDRLAGDGPPVVLVVAAGSDDLALDAFRRGAADCVRMGRDHGEVLPVVALEQIRRWRQLRERRRAERTIAWLERLHDAIVGEIPVSLAVLDGDHRFVMINPEFGRVFGLSRARAEGRRFDQVLPADLVESGGLGDLLASGGSGACAMPRLARSRGPDGQPRVFDLRCQRLDEQGRLLLVLSDLSESELLARRVGELQRYNENIIQNINSALLVIDTGGRVIFANPAAAQILGVEADQLSGHSVEGWFRDGGERRSLLVRSLEEGARFKGAETMLARGDGSVVPVGISCAPLLGDAGETTGVVAIFQDLSEIKQLQRQVLQTEKMASIGQLAAGVAHEINNPMGFIHANLYQMSEYLEDLQRYWDAVDALQSAVQVGDGEAVRDASRELVRISEEIDVEFVKQDFVKAVRESQEGSERIRHIVQDLRDFSHQDTVERLFADVNQCVDSTANIVWTMMKHSVVLEKEYEDLPQIRCYPMQLKQVFMNLLVNAYQAIEAALAAHAGARGGAGERGVIRIQTARQGNGVVVRIRDTGIGIPRQNLARIFDPFFTTKEVGTGTGLGLSTSYGIVQRHGGRMRVESEEGHGSLFEVWLPVSFDEGDHEPGRES